jgi:hypothetical protein
MLQRVVADTIPYIRPSYDHFVIDRNTIDSKQLNQN